MVRTASFLIGIVIALRPLGTGEACAQRIHFPSPATTSTVSSTASTIAPGWTGNAQGYTAAQPPSSPSIYAPATPPGSSTLPPPTYPPAGPSVYAPGGASPYAPPVAPSYPPGASPPYAPGAPPSYGTSPGYVPGPSATFQGNIQPPPAWDPYATPGMQSPGLLPQDPYLSGPPGGYFGPGSYMEKVQRFLEQVRLDYVYMPGNARKEMGINDVDLSASFAFPFLYNPDTPLLVSPGFAVHYWNGPPGPPLNDFNMPPRVYDAYLDAAWNPRVNETFGGELDFRIGVYSDFRRLITDSIRFQGTGLAVISVSPAIQIKAGAMYLDRERFLMFPAGGVVWTPNPDVRFEILFPNPRIAARLTTIGNTDVWGYLRGEYGGGSWTMKDLGLPGSKTVFVRDYNDIRVGAGLEFERLNGIKGLAESGIAFDREIYGDGIGKRGKLLDLNPTIYVRGGLAY